VTKYQLEAYAKPMFGRSGHCPGIVYSKGVHDNNSERGMPTNFISIGKVEFKDLTVGAQKYVLEGEVEGLHTRYKCRIRKPWYSVPSVYATNLGMMKRAHNYPRLILNSAGAYTTDTAYRISSNLNPEKLVYCFINSLTALTAEMEGRHYGGGVLEMVPSEIEKLLIPVVDVKNMDLTDLDARISVSHDPDALFIAQDKKILMAAGFSKKDCRIIHQAWIHIRSRRQRLLGDVNHEAVESV
jgi:adenine-specific DNA-methyltransferase